MFDKNYFKIENKGLVDFLTVPEVYRLIEVLKFIMGSCDPAISSEMKLVVVNPDDTNVFFVDAHHRRHLKRIIVNGE